MKKIKLEEQFQLGDQVYLYTKNQEGKPIIKSVASANVKKGKVEKPLPVPPTLSDCIVHFHKKGYNSTLAKQFFDYYTDAIPAWHDKNKNPVLNWKQKSLFWCKGDEHKLPVKEKSESLFRF